MSCVTYEQVAKEAYIAYLNTKGFAPKNAKHFINFCNSHKPPFIGVNYKIAKQIVKQPPSTNIERKNEPQQAQNPYLDTSLIQQAQNINQNVIKTTNINDIYELYKQKNGIYPNNAMQFLSICQTNKFNITYSECSRFLSTKPKRNQSSRVRALSMISSDQAQNKNKNNNKTRERAKSVGKLNTDSILHKMKQFEVNSYQQRLNELNRQKNIKTPKQIQTIDAKIKIEKMIKKTEEKNETQIGKIKYKNQNIQQLNSNKKLMENINNKRNVNQLEMEEKNYQNIQPIIIETQQSDLGSTFLSDDTFTSNIINCTKSNGIELSDKFIHIDIDPNNAEKTKEAVNIVTRRAFQSRFVAPINNIAKGKIYGEMTMLLPSGLTNKQQFNGEHAYHATATFKQSDISQETSKYDTYYDESSFNPIYKSTKDTKSTQTCFIENDTNISSTIHANDSCNQLHEEISITLQQQHLSKMNEMNKMNKVYHSDSIPTSEIFKIPTTAPKESCRAYFTGLLVGGTFIANEVSVAYKIDNCSEYVGQGEYSRNREAFPKAVATTFDGIAIDRNTRVIIYEKENFQGNTLLDAKGPKIINNGKWKNSYGHCKTDIFPDPELQKNFPIEVRMWTESDMHQWSYGSVKILSNVLNE